MNCFSRYLIIIMLLSLAMAGCRKNAAPAAPESRTTEYSPAPAAITPPEPQGAVEPVEATRSEAVVPPEIFIEAERSFTAGDYRRAAQLFEKFLYTFPKSPERDRALFHLGFSLALSGDDRSLFQTEATLRRLITEFTQSPYRRQAEWILNLKTRVDRLEADISDRDQRIRQLSDELRKLKSIDLDRRPSRPE